MRFILCTFCMLPVVSDFNHSDPIKLSMTKISPIFFDAWQFCWYSKLSISCDILPIRLHAGLSIYPVACCCWSIVCQFNAIVFSSGGLYSLLTCESTTWGNSGGVGHKLLSGRIRPDNTPKRGCYRVRKNGARRNSYIQQTTPILP